MTSDALQEIEGALLQRGYPLAFQPALEAAYERRRGEARTRSMRRFLLLYVGIVLVCLFCDIGGAIPILRACLMVRLGICIPIALLSFFLLGRRLSPGLWGLAAVTPMVVEVLCSMTLARFLGGHTSGYMTVGPALCIFVQTLVAPVPFRYALRGLLVALTAFVALSLLPGPGHARSPIGLPAPTFACGVGAAALYERHRRERAERRTFLLIEANRLRLDDICRLNAHLQRLSSLDGLTGVFNRRYLDAALSRLWMVAADNRRWIGVLLVDIDHFKALNDVSGHQYGDYCLQQVAQMLQRSVRSGVDTIARYGGEEFVAILPDSEMPEVLAVGERIRATVEAAGIRSANGSVVTISIGAVAVRGGYGSLLTLEGFIEAADQALYKAKHAGRNRIICSDVLLSQDA